MSSSASFPDFPDNQVVTIQTSRGPVDIAFDLETEGDTLHLKDTMVYARQKEPLSGILRELLAARGLIARYAGEAGYKKVRISGWRSLRSTSAKPGKKLDITLVLPPA